jgi:hypothetical protein
MADLTESDMELGPPIRPQQPPAEEKWSPVDGKPDLWVNAKGQMKYTPEPPPSTYGAFRFLIETQRRQ